jgi:hypothetical protein
MIGTYALFVRGDDHRCTVVEVYTNTTVGKGVSHTILVAVINPGLNEDLRTP